MNDRNRPSGGVCANLFAVCTHTLESCFVGHLYVVIPELVLLTSLCLEITNGQTQAFEVEKVLTRFKEYKSNPE